VKTVAIRIIIGSNNEKTSKQLGKFLMENDMHIVAEIMDGFELLRKVHLVFPDLVIIDDFIKGMKNNDICEILVEEKICPVISLTKEADASNFVNLNQEPLFSLVIKPTSKDILLNTIHLMVKSSKSILALQKKMSTMEKEKDHQEVIAEAKKVLMKNMNLTEEEAHRKIQKQSMDKGLSKLKVAEMIIRIYK
jgi:two-component system, response regulator PdtaR